MTAPSPSLFGLRTALLGALGLAGCTSRPIDDPGAGDLDTTGKPGTATGMVTTTEPGVTTTEPGVTTTGVTTTAGSTTTGNTTAIGSTTGEDGGTTTTTTTTTGVDLSTSGTTDGGTSTTGSHDLPCTPLNSLGVDLMAADVNMIVGCEAAGDTDCVDYLKVCVPLPDGLANCEACGPDCVGPLPMVCNAFINETPVCGPVAEGEQCCQVYTYGWHCTDGRPFVVAGESRVAPAIADPAWAGRVTPTLLAELGAEERAGLAALWTADGLAEHASVASFARFTLQLLALGAPPQLVADACRAQIEEVGHARTTLALAAAYGGPVGPGALPIEGAMIGATDREAVLVATFIEGCVGETIAAAELELAAQGCADPAVAATLKALAADEQRHAALAWRTVQWLLRAEDGTGLRGALARAVAGVGVPAVASDTLPAALLRRHGRLPAGERAGLVAQCLRSVIRPCVAALLAETATREARCSAAA